eukprot:gene2276-17889_t
MARTVAFLCTFLAVDATILRLLCLEYGKFNIIKTNVALQGSVIATFASTGVDKCEEKCLLNPLCKTVNTKDDGTSCQLNSQSYNALSSGHLLVEKTGWTFRSTNSSDTLIGEVCQELNPCRYGYTCKDTCSCPGYECLLSDCKILHESGIRSSGVYPNRGSNKGMIFCDLNTSNKWWIVFQRRVDASISFYRNWNAYRNGFGDMSRNFWLGLEKIHQLALPGRGATLRVEFKHVNFGNRLFYAEYKDFSISAESDGYRLNVGEYSGDGADSLINHNGMRFTTFDRDHDFHPFTNCAINSVGAWWYKACHWSNLNGLFPPPPHSYWTTKYMSWYQLLQKRGGIFYSEMKLTY